MAMPSGNSVIPRKMQFPNGGDAHSQRQWFPDERDGFIYWLKGEFAAANAIIDSLCEHLRTTSDTGEYDMVIGCIQQRRCNWTPVLYLQQYFSVAEINLALQQVAWRKQPRHFDQPKPVEKDFKKPAFGYRQVQKLENIRENHSSSAQYMSPGTKSEKTEEEPTKSEEVKQKTGVQVPHGNGSNFLPEKEGWSDGSSCKGECSQKEAEDSVGPICDKLDSVSIGDGVIVHGKGQDATPNEEGRQKSVPIPKVFECNELCNGKMVNVVDGLQLYDDLFENSEISTLFAVANEWRISGQKGEFQAGQTFVGSKRPSKGHGRDMLQFGVPVTDRPPEDENGAAISKERKVDPLPSAIQEIIDRLVSRQVVASRPDYCIVDFYNEGDHSQPFMWPPWYGRPVFSLFLTESDVVFGQVIGVDHRGNYRGPLKLSLSPGSLLVMQGRSADLAKHALSSTRKPRVILLFGKSLPRKPPPPWAPLPGRPHPKHYPVPHAAGVLQPPAVPPLFIAAAPPLVTAALPLPPAASPAWPPAAPPRLPVPGTGVFLPPTHPPPEGEVPPPPAAQEDSPGGASKKKPAAGSSPAGASSK